MSNLLHIISIVLSLLSIVISILVYFGIIRYIHLYFSKTVDKYTEKYTDLPMASENKTIIVLSIDSEEDLKNIFPTVNSILDQTVRVNQIFLVVPCSSTFEIPENLLKVVSVVKPGKVYDDKYQDIISILEREKEKNTIIIRISKGIIYGKEFIENIIEISESNPDSVINDESNLFFVLKPSFIKFDESSKNVNFICDIKNMYQRENYKII